jgi:hypothetical protein
MNALEAFLGSFGIFLFGLVSIPVVLRLHGVRVTIRQNVFIGLTFFILRFFWLYFLREVFS